MPVRSEKIQRARSLRKSSTKSESLAWEVLRSKQLCDLKFRRQHPIGPFFADFACVSQKLVVELDGGYHDNVGEADLVRENYLLTQGWKVIRFSDTEVENDVEAFAVAVAKSVGLNYNFRKRKKTGSGLKSNEE